MNVIQDMEATLKCTAAKRTQLHCFGHDHNVRHKDTMITRVWMREVRQILHMMMLIEKVPNPSTASDGDVFQYVARLNDFYFVPNKHNWIHMGEVQKIQQTIDAHAMHFMFLR
jgi:hypothetical protein